MFKICINQLHRSFSSIRFYVALMIGIAMQIIAVIPLLNFSEIIGQPLCLFDSFIYFNCDDYTASTAFLGVLLLASDVPFSSCNETYTLLRTTRKNWILGKVIYLACVCFVYYLIIAIMGMLYIYEKAILSNEWSYPLRMLSKDTSSIYTIDFSVFFPYSHILASTTPLESFCISVLLSTAYAFSCCLLLFWLNLILPRSLGFFLTVLVHIAGYTFSTIFVSSSLAKISLFGNSLLMYHSLEKSSNNLFYLSVSQSFYLFGIFCFIVFFLLKKSIRKYDFKIPAGV